MSDREITAQLQAALMKSFPLPEYATFLEVGDATGARGSRWADAVSMACWPSRGLRIWGFEIKASRSDWLREKKNPKKSVAIQRFCHHWVLITPPDIIAPGELPETWGHMVFKGGRLVTEAKAPLLTPDALEPPFVASLLRCCGQTSAQLMSQGVAEATKDFRLRLEKDMQRQMEQRRAEGQSALEAVRKFKESAGVDLLSWKDTDAGQDFAAYREACITTKHAFGWSTSAKALRAAADAIDAAEAAVRTAKFPLKDHA